MDDGRRSFYQLGIGLPHWFVATLGALLPIYWLATVRVRIRRNRRPPGFCQSCGYDLRATPEQCPECGLIADPANEAAI